jgi:excisionase family DNA binding protein
MAEQLPELLTVEEVARMLRTTPRAVRGRIERGSIPEHLLVPGMKPRLFYHDKVREWLRLNTATGE